MGFSVVYSSDALGNEKLVSHLFDISPSAENENETDKVNRSIEIAINNSSVLGRVALSRQPMIINQAYNNQHFNKSVDEETKFSTKSIRGFA